MLHWVKCCSENIVFGSAYLNFIECKMHIKASKITIVATSTLPSVYVCSKSNHFNHS